MIGFAATLLALKFAESTRGIEFEGWDDILGTAVICWASSWILELGWSAFISPDHWSPAYTVGFALGTEFIATMVGLLLAWAFVSGTRIKSTFGLILAAVLVVVFAYGAQMLVAGSSLGWL
jgi:hypothetical protein